MSESALQLRPVRGEDAPFLLRAYAASREIEMAMVPWTPEQKETFLRGQFEAQTREYTHHYPQAEHSVIVYQGREAGRVFVVREADRIHILDLVVLTAERNAGAGSAVIRGLQQDAAAARVPLTIHVETFSPSLAFFEKRGFKPEKQTGIHVLLKWMPE